MPCQEKHLVHRPWHRAAHRVLERVETHPELPQGGGQDEEDEEYTENPKSF
jgi:hypothetical protein